MDCTFVIQVWHEDSSANATYADFFDSLSNACSYAVANKGKIAYGLPAVIKIYSYYDSKKEQVTVKREEVKPEDVYLIALNRAKIRQW